MDNPQQSCESQQIEPRAQGDLEKKPMVMGRAGWVEPSPQRPGPALRTECLGSQQTRAVRCACKPPAESASLGPSAHQPRQCEDDDAS